MKALPQQRGGRRRWGFTLVEMLSAVGVAAILSAACLTAFAAIQRCYQLSMARSNVRTNVVRLFDSLQMDLRNATTVSALVSGSQNVLPLTLTMPQRYTDYEPAGDLAGDPGRAAARVTPKYDTKTGKLVVAGTIKVTYAAAADSATTETITRRVEWTAADGTRKSAERSVSTLPAGMTFRMTGPAGGLMKADDLALVASVSATSNVSDRESAPIELASTIFLRGKALP